MDVIYFCRIRDPYGELSNFYPSPIKDSDGLIWPTSEHLYHASKFSDPAIGEAM